MYDSVRIPVIEHGYYIANECIFTRTELSNAHKKLHLQDAKLRLVMSLHYIPVYLTQGYAHATKCISINVQFLGKTYETTDVRTVLE